MKRSKVRMVLEAVGPSTEIEGLVETFTHAAQQFKNVQVSFPEPVRISAVVRERKKAASKVATIAEGGDPTGQKGR